MLLSSTDIYGLELSADCTASLDPSDGNAWLTAGTGSCGLSSLDTNLGKKEASMGDTTSGSAISSEVEEVRVGVLDTVLSTFMADSGRPGFELACD